MDRITGYDSWKLQASPSNEHDVVPPQLETVCMKCNQYLLEMDGSCKDSWDCSVSIDYDFGNPEVCWSYWHEHCQAEDKQ